MSLLRRRPEPAAAPGPLHPGPWPAVRPAVRVRRPGPEVEQAELEQASEKRVRARPERRTRSVGPGPAVRGAAALDVAAGRTPPFTQR